MAKNVDSERERRLNTLLPWNVFGGCALAKQDEIQSTEKLLNLIRTQDQIDSTGMAPTSPPVSLTGISVKKNKKIIAGKVRLGKKIVIGVDIGHTYIKLAKIQQNSDKSYELLDYLDVPLQKSFSLKDPKNQELIKSTMHRFCGADTHALIWSAITSADVETRCIHIPKLPGKQIHNAVYWTFTKKVPLNPSEEVLDYEILGDITDGGVKKTEITVFKAPRKEIDTLKNVFQSIGYPLNGISIVPFAIQNLFRTSILSQREEDVCCLFVGRDWSRIAIYSKGNIVLSRGIKAGMRSMIEAINTHLAPKTQPGNGASGDPATVVDDADRSATIDPASQKLFFDFIASTQDLAAPSAVLQGHSPLQVFQMLLPAMERLIRQIERTFEHYSLNFHHEGIRQIFLSGPITASKLVVDHIGNQLDLPITVMDPFGTEPAFYERVNIPNGDAERESYVPSIGLALSNNQRTPNFLFTHQDRQRVNRARSNNMRVLTACLMCLIIMIAVFSYQERRLDQKRMDVARLNNQLYAFNPPAKKDNLLALYAKTKDKRQTTRKISVRYAPLAVVNELARLTPSHVRLLNLDSAFSNDAEKPANQTGTLTVQGIIFGDSATLETSLTSYLFSLKNSQLFDKPNILEKQEAYYNNRQVLRFNVKLVIK